MPTIKDIIDSIEEFAPRSYQEQWDNCGLQIGYSIDRECSGAVIALDVTMAAVEEAVKIGANLIATHHPFTIEGIKNFTSQSEQGRIIECAIKNNIAIYSAHTSLDSCIGGLNDHLSSLFELSDIEVLQPNAANPSVGIGRIGDLPQAISAEELANKLKGVLNLESIRYSDAGALIRRVALCSGGGASLIEMVKSSGVDAYLCGDLKYHNFGDMASGGVSLFDIGHFESEICAIDILSSIITEKFTNFAPRKFRYNYISTLY